MEFEPLRRSRAHLYTGAHGLVYLRSAEGSLPEARYNRYCQPLMGRQSDCHPKRSSAPLAPLRGYPFAGTFVPPYSFISITLIDRITATGLFLCSL